MPIDEEVDYGKMKGKIEKALKEHDLPQGIHPLPTTSIGDEELNIASASSSSTCGASSNSNNDDTSMS